MTNNNYTHYQDTNMGGLLQLGVRFLDPSVGRFTQVDPAGDGYNLYVCGDCNPMSNVDPTGEIVIAVPVVGVAIGAGEAAALIIGAGAVLCGANQECRDAMLSAAQEIRDWIGAVAKGTVDVCQKAIKIRCNIGNHKDRHPFPRHDGKICWQSHMQINCWLKGVKDSDKNFRWAYGPCYKHRTGPEILQ